MKYLSRLFYYLLIAMFSVTLLGCGDDDDDDDDDNGPDPTDIDEGTLIFTLDGDEISFDFVLGTLTDDSDVGGLGDGEFLSVGGTDQDASGILSIGIIDEEMIQEQSYSLIDEESQEDFPTGAVFSYILLDEELGFTTVFVSSGSAAGNVTITEIDRNDETVSGTFSGSLIRQELDADGNVTTSETSSITGGAFNKVPLI